MAAINGTRTQMYRTAESSHVQPIAMTKYARKYALKLAGSSFALMR